VSRTLASAKPHCHSTREIFSLDRLHVNRFMPLNDAAMNYLRAVWVNSREQARSILASAEDRDRR
jgi:hypothetical protein